MEQDQTCLEELCSLCSANLLPNPNKRGSDDSSISLPIKKLCRCLSPSCQSHPAELRTSIVPTEAPNSSLTVTSSDLPIAKSTSVGENSEAELSMFEKQVRARIVSPEYEKQWTEDCTSFDYLKSLRLAAEKITPLQPIILPRKTAHSRLLVFDLDNTLVHCSPKTEGAEHVIQVPLPNGRSIAAGIRIRPYARECLQAASRYFEVAVFTASHSCYSDQVVDLLDPHRSLVQHRLFREHCLQINEKLLVKDLRVISNFALKDIAIIENSLLSFGLQLYNGVPVLTWNGERRDTELKSLLHYLRPLSLCEDIRVLNRRVFEAYYSCLSDEDSVTTCEA